MDYQKDSLKNILMETRPDLRSLSKDKEINFLARPNQ